MSFIRRIIRAFLAWTMFMFILGALFAGLGGQRNHKAVLLCDAIFLIGAGFVLARWLGRRAARRDALAAEQLLQQQAAEQQQQQSLATITVVIGDQQVPVTIIAGVSAHELPLEADLQPQALYEPEPLEDVPGLRGAQMALATHAAQSTQPGAIAVSYGGEIKAYVSRGGWELVGDFANTAPEDPVYRLVAVMAVYAQNVLLGFESEYTDADAMAYALGEFVPLEMLERGLPNPEQTAIEFGLPADVLRPQNLRGLSTAIAARNAAEARMRQAQGSDI
jgi:hypothetical protein